MQMDENPFDLLDTEARRLDSFYGRLAGDQWDAPTRCAGWTRKDLLAHMAWWHDHSARVIEGLRAGRQPYDVNDPANSTDALNERTHREHLDDPPELTRRAFDESFNRLLAALEPVTDEELFADDRWPWLDGEALVETILWDSSRHYEAHREHLEPLSR